MHINYLIEAMYTDFGKFQKQNQRHAKSHDGLTFIKGFPLAKKGGFDTETGIRKVYTDCMAWLLGLFPQTMGLNSSKMNSLASARFEWNFSRNRIYQ